VGRDLRVLCELDCARWYRQPTAARLPQFVPLFSGDSLFMLAPRPAPYLVLRMASESERYRDEARKIRQAMSYLKDSLGLMRLAQIAAQYEALANQFDKLALEGTTLGASAAVGGNGVLLSPDPLLTDPLMPDSLMPGPVPPVAASPAAAAGPASAPPASGAGA
jgi:hypothetical protein